MYDKEAEVAERNLEDRIQNLEFPAYRRDFFWALETPESKPPASL
jgi:hypothetical protein